MQQRGLEVQEAAGDVAYAVGHGPKVPVFQVDFKVDVDEAVGQRRRLSVDHRAVAGAVAGGDDGPAVGHGVVAQLAVQDELVRRSLDGLGRTIHFVEEQNALAFGGQEVRGYEGHDFVFARAAHNREALEVHGVHEVQANVTKFELEIFGDRADDVGLACAHRAPDKGGALAGDEVLEGEFYLGGAHLVSFQSFREIERMRVRVR